MLDRPILAFDIETIPDVDVGRRVLGMDGTDAEVVTGMLEQRLTETGGKRDFPHLPHHRIVTIGVAWLDPQSDRFRLGTCGGDSPDERTQLQELFAILGKSRPSPRLVSWNGGGFDLPVIRYRAMAHGLAAPELYRHDGEWKWNNYQNRYHDMHVDLMDVLSGYGASARVGLGTLSEVVGLVGKRFVDEPVHAHWLRGEHALVREYCKLDVVETLLLFLLWAVHCGQADPHAVGRWVESVRAAVAEETFEGWAEVARCLEHWSPWTPRSAAA
jgi:predicted PolB exonuclease-like 3'-5' exonuclease